jgi:triosephosphate isomerase
MGKQPRRTFIVGGNWKCNGTKASIEALVAEWNKGADLSNADVEVVIAPPAVYCDYTRSVLRADFQMMVQNVWVGKGGAYTGEMSADMVCDFGFGWAMTGHSERRSLPALRESDETIAEKTKYCLEKGLSVMFCIGETLQERESGQCDAVNQRQLKALQSVIMKRDWARIVVAYEPVWAIGTGVSCPPEKAQETHKSIRDYLRSTEGDQVADSVRIVYGGSVSPANCEALSKCPDIDGFLVGGASLKPDFLKVIDSYKLANTQ